MNNKNKMKNTEKKDILIYNIALLPDGWDLETLQRGIEECNTVYYDSSQCKYKEYSKIQAPRYVNITEDNNIDIKDIKDMKNDI
jgi:hypothetical protein